MNRTIAKNFSVVRATIQSLCSFPSATYFAGSCPRQLNTTWEIQI